MIDELKPERRLVGSNNIKIPDTEAVDIGYGIKTYVPKVDYYLNLIKNGVKFKYLRLNHGMLDPFVPVFKMDELSYLIETKKYDEVSNRMVKYHHNNNGYLKSWSPMDNKYAQLLSFFLKFFNESINDSNSEYDFGVSLCNGILRARGGLDSPVVKSRGDVFKILSNNKDINYFHGGLARHYAVTGEIYQFFDLLNELDYDVIFVGAPYFQMAKYEYNIKNFKHILISYRNAILKFDETIVELKNSITKPNTIILNSTGHDLSFYLADSLRGMDVSQFDIGRALDWNMYQSFKTGKFKDEFDNLPNFYKPWNNLGQNPWLVQPISQHIDIVKRLRSEF